MTVTTKTNGSTARQNASTFGPANRVGRNLAGLTDDVVSLAELQVKLFSADAGQLLQSSKLATAMIGIAGVLGVSSLPVVIGAAGWELAAWTELNLALSLLLSALVFGLIPAACLAWYGVRRIRQDLRLLDRSRSELSRNIAWFRETIRYQSGR